MKKELTKEEKGIQKILNRIISEEILAHMFYSGCMVTVKNCKSDGFFKMFSEIAEDELNDHYIKLKNWAIENKFDVPFKMKDYAKYAESDTKQLDSLKVNADPIYYIDEALLSESKAILSYEDALKNNFIPYDLNSILLQNYYDELTHLKQLNALKFTLEAGAELIQY